MSYKIKKFDTAYKRFIDEEDPVVHKKAIKCLLSNIDLEKEFVELLNESDGVKNFFLMWEKAGEEEKDPVEKIGLKKIGKLSKKLYNKRKYKQLCELFFDIALKHIVEFIHLQEREDFESITDVDLYAKNLIPPEIFLQFFLIETLVKGNDFNWDMKEEIINQNLACFIVCFSDLYGFFHENE